MKPPRIHGIPLHPALVHFPVAAWTVATGLSALAMISMNAELALAARYTNILGLISGLAAMTAGFLELAGLPEEPDLRNAAARHMMMACCCWMLYVLAFLLQVKASLLYATVASGAGFVLLLFAGHAGARLVYHHGYPPRHDRLNE